MIAYTKYHTNFPKCVLCGLMYTAASIEDGICVPCRNSRTIKKINLATVLLWLAAIFFLIFIASFTKTAGAETSLAWIRCYHHGDWRETPYCNAAARDLPNV